MVVQDFQQFESLFVLKPDYYLVVSKDPYSWYVSYRNWARVCHWPTVRHHYIEEYNLFYGKFLELARQTDRIIFVRYMDLLADSVGMLGYLERTMKLEKTFLSTLFRKRPGRVPLSTRYTQKERVEYLNEGFLQKMSAAEFEELNRNLDKGVCRALGYEVKMSSG